MPPEKGDLPPPQAFRPGPEMGLPTELLRGGESGRLYPIEEEDLIDILAAVEVGEAGNTEEIEAAIQLALGFREGLIYGNEGYVLEGKDTTPVLLKLQNDFTTVEESTERPRDSYLTPAIKKLLGSKVREVQFQGHNRALWEKMMRRKYPQLADGQLEAALDKERARVQRYGVAKNKLISIENQIDARRILDAAFIQRMETCTSPEAAAELMMKDRRYGPPVSPDKGHWEAFFDGKWGKDVDAVFWEIVKFGLPHDRIAKMGLDPIPANVRRKDKKKDPEASGLVPDTVYVDGFPNTAVFKAWLGHLLNKADGRLDVVWAAWKLALTTEVVDSVLGEKIKTTPIDPNNPEGPKKIMYDLIAPPLGNALFTYTAHLQEKRLLEFGLQVDGKTRTEQVAKYISHSGLPMSLQQLPDLCRSFFQEATIKIPTAELLGDRKETFDNLLHNLPEPSDPDYPNDSRGRTEYDRLKEHLQYLKDKSDGRAIDPKIEKRWGKEKKVDISLWNLAFYGRLGFAGRGEEEFPWLMTEGETAEEIPGEVPPGGFEGWLLRRFRANSIREVILSRPSLRDLGDPDFFIKQLRNMEKVWGKLKDDAPPEENPRNWLLAGWIYLHFGGTGDKKVDEKLIPADQQYMKYRIYTQSERLESRPAGLEDRGVSVGDVLQNALNCGYIREKDKVWLVSLLKIHAF